MCRTTCAIARSRIVRAWACLTKLRGSLLLQGAKAPSVVVCVHHSSTHKWTRHACTQGVSCWVRTNVLFKELLELFLRDPSDLIHHLEMREEVEGRSG